MNLDDDPVGAGGGGGQRQRQDEVAAAGGVGFWTMLNRMRDGTFDPRGVPSMLVGKPLPTFSLPGQTSGSGFSSADVIAAGRPVLINFFASWCVPCVVEAPLLMQLRAANTPIWQVTDDSTRIVVNTAE